MTIWETAMSKFQLFDAVSLTEPITLTDGGIAPPETAGAIVEIFKNGSVAISEIGPRNYGSLRITRRLKPRLHKQNPPARVEE